PLAAAVTWTFTTTTAPEMTSASPANNATSASTWPGKISATMDMPILSTSLTTATVTLKKPDGTQLGAVPSLDTSTNPTILTPTTIAGTTDMPLYQAQRIGNTLGAPIYTLPVSNGTYTVKLYFAEIQKTAIGQRVFNVDVSGTTPNPDIASLDIYAAAGGANKALVKTVTGAVACGAAIRVTTTAVTDFPAIAAIEVIPTGPAVCATSPANAATAVAKTTAVTATFSGGMTGSSITASSFTLTPNGGTPIGATVGYDATALKATLTPNVALAANTTYTAKLDSNVLCSDGLALPAPYTC